MAATIALYQAARDIVVAITADAVVVKRFTVARVVPQLIAMGRYAPPSPGIMFDVRINAAVNRQGVVGMLVLDVLPGTDVARAGL